MERWFLYQPFSLTIMEFMSARTTLRDELNQEIGVVLNAGTGIGAMQQNVRAVELIERIEME